MTIKEKNEIRKFVLLKLRNNYGLDDFSRSIIDSYFNEAIERTLYCISHVKDKYTTGVDGFNIFNSTQGSVFLYYLTNSIFRGELFSRGGASNPRDLLNTRVLCDKLYNLYKMLYCFELYYEVEMPDIFFGWHPMGAVIGRASYSDGFFFYQGCNVGENLPTGMGHPSFGENVLMCVNSTVLGNCNVGSNVILGANSYIKDIDIPDNTIVFGQYPDVKFRNNNTSIILELRR